MELNFSEIDSKTPYDSFDYNGYEGLTNNTSNKYWEKNTKPPQTTPQTKKKKVSFDDILTNMNLVVNKSGVLQFMSQPQEIQQQTQTQYQEEPQYQQQQPQYQQQQPQYQQQQTQYQQQQTQYQPQTQYQQQPLDPSVKHSYIYNKYFKDYQDANPIIPEVRVPKTKREYLKMLIEERNRQIMERKRISQIKSTKLLFTTNVGNNGNIPVSKNSLRKMGFN